MNSITKETEEYISINKDKNLSIIDNPVIKGKVVIGLQIVVNDSMDILCRSWYNRLSVLTK